MSDVFQRLTDAINRLTVQLQGILRTQRDLMIVCRFQLDRLIPILQEQAQGDEVKLAIVAQAQRLRRTLDDLQMCVDGAQTPPAELLQIIQRAARAIASLQRTSQIAISPDVDANNQWPGVR